MQKKRFAIFHLFAFIPVIVLLLILLPNLSIAQTNVAPGNILKIKSTKDFTVTGDGSSENWKSAEWNDLQQHGSNTVKKADRGESQQTSRHTMPHYKTSFKVL